MTFTQYLNQTEVKRRHGVEVREADCFMVIPNPIPGIKRSVVLKMFDRHYYYIQKNDGGRLLWTQDEDGNPKSPSCFVFIEETEKELV